MEIMQSRRGPSDLHIALIPGWLIRPTRGNQLERGAGAEKDFNLCNVVVPKKRYMGILLAEKDSTKGGSAEEQTHFCKARLL